MKVAEDFLQRIKEGDESYMENLYGNWRNDFKIWFEQKYKLNSEESSSLYQDAFLAFYMNIKSEKILEIDHPKTYLFGIGKNLMRQKFKTSDRIIENIEDTEIIDNETFLTFQEKLDENDQMMKVLEIFGEPCKSLLLMFYFHSFSHDVIAERMGYKNDKVVKKKKSLCMSELRKMWNEFQNKIK